MTALLVTIPSWYQRLGVGAFVIIAVFLLTALCWQLWYRWQLRQIRQRTAEQATSGSDEPVGSSCSFGYKMAWLAVRSRDIDAVRESLGFEQDVRNADCAEGVREVYANNEDWVFLTPPIEGWVFVVGWWIWPADPADLTERLLSLSSSFGQAAAFVSQRVSSSYGWARAIDGEMVRSFYIADGEVLLDQGRPKPPESRLSINWGKPDERLLELDEESVLRVARDWSLDPQTLDGRDGIAAPGLLCRASK